MSRDTPQWGVSDPVTDPASQMHHMSGIDTNNATNGFGHSLGYGSPWYVFAASQTTQLSNASDVMPDTNSSYGSLKMFVRAKADAPGVPRNITVESGDGRNVVSWDPPPEANASTTYIVYWATSPGVVQGESDGFVGEITDNSFTHTAATGLQNGIMHYYVVSAVINDALVNDYSAEVGATPYGSLSAPQNLFVDEITDPTTLILTWSPVPGAVEYIIYMSTDSNLTPEGVYEDRNILANNMIHAPNVAGQPEMFEHPDGLAINMPYFFRVAAIDQFGRIGLLSDEKQGQAHGN